MDQHHQIRLSNQFALIQNLSKIFSKTRRMHQKELIDDYIKLINDLIQEHGKARQTDLASRLGVSQPTVSKKIKQLITKNLIKQQPYHSISLTKKGKQLACKNNKRHKIVKSFLLALGISPITAHQDAEGIEHHVSHETLLIFRNFIKIKK